MIDEGASSNGRRAEQEVQRACTMPCRSMPPSGSVAREGHAAVEGEVEVEVVYIARANRVRFFCQALSS